ncbi:hypothetical protein JYT19_00475 [Sulfobacillus acidophilus]|uniref:Uncharacterized protein n=1 Tax=Sulfobacillus acidophilus TaxID=53633 RepID=A0ABS3AVH8_9FIRM|nr:hypothetical protein [Sulfobacillus acidophilus]
MLLAKYVKQKHFMLNKRFGMKCFFVLCLCFCSALFAQKSNENSLIVIEENEEYEPHEIKHISDGFAHGTFKLPALYQFTAKENHPFRILPSILLKVGGSISVDLDVSISGFTRAIVGLYPAKYNFDWQIYDSYLKFHNNDLSVHVGYLVVPWEVTQGIGLLNRLNPIDYRQGPMFGPNFEGRMPQLGALIQTSFFGVGFEAAGFFHHTPSRGCFVSSQIGGLQIGHYQQALIQLPKGGETFFSGEDRSKFLTPSAFFAPSLAFLLKKNFGSVDARLSGVWNFNEVPFFNFTNNTLFYTRTATLGFGAIWSLGAILLKAEGLVQPKIWGGKTTTLQKGNEFNSANLDHLAFVVGIEGSYGELFSGSFELLNKNWLGVNEDEVLFGVGKPSRLALAVVFEGKFAQNWQWKLKGEAGIIEPDFLMNSDFLYHFKNIDFKTGVFANIFAGSYNTPGWLMNSSSQIGILLKKSI